MFSITRNLQAALDNSAKVTQIILQIDGVATIYSSVEVKKIPRFDDGYVFDEIGLYFDTPIVDISTRDYIQPSGSTKNITQQMNQDKGASTSITQVNISLVDKNKSVSTNFSSLEMLSREATIYLSFEGLEHPSDSVRILSGIISNYSVLPGEVKLTIDSPNTLEKQKILVPLKDEIVSAITDSQNFLHINSNKFALLSGPISWYAKIDEEIVRFTGLEVDGAYYKATGVTRAQLGTVESAHDAGANFELVFGLEENPLRLALILLMSNRYDENVPITAESRYLTSKKPSYFVSYPGKSVPNSIHFNDPNIEDSYGLVLGDFVRITDSTSNNGIELEIIAIGRNDNNTSYVVVNSFITDEEIPGSCLVHFKSKYNIAYDGCQLSGKQVDVSQFENVMNVFGSQFPSLKFYLEDEVDIKEFIEKEIFFPIGCFSLMRLGRISVGYTSPAIGQLGQVTLDINNIVSPEKIQPTRSINKYFYNSVVFKYEHDLVTDKFKSSRIIYSADSANRIKVGNRPLTIESKGLRKGSSETYIDLVARNLIERYRYAADSIKVEVLFGAGFSVEVGDVIIFDGRELDIYDSESGTAGTYIRQMEVQNKSLDFSTGKVTLDLLSTNYLTDSRYAFIGPASIIRSVSGTKITLEKSFGTGDFNNEQDKWSKYVGLVVKIHNEDFTESEHVTLESISESEDDVIYISTPTMTVTSDMTLTCPDYDQADDTFKKLVFYTSPRVLVVSSADSTHITVSSGDIGKFFIGCKIDVIKSDFSDRQELIEVIGIATNTLELGTALDFSLIAGDYIDRIGFAYDEGDAYTII